MGDKKVFGIASALKKFAESKDVAYSTQYIEKYDMPKSISNDVCSNNNRRYDFFKGLNKRIRYNKVKIQILFVLWN